LEELQDEVPSFSFEQARTIIETELGRPLSELFQEFDPIPIASASLSQVHAACLSDGENVVVKVQRPGIREVVAKDLEILHGMAKVAQRHSKIAEIYDAPGLIDELDRTLREELDFSQEARNMQIIGDNLEEFDLVYVPEVYPRLSTGRVLTMERVGGVKVAAARTIGINTKKLAAQFVRAFIKQVAVDGIFHADAHPGNLFVRHDGSIALIDFGMVGRLDQRTKRQVTRLILAFMQEQGTEVARAALELGDTSSTRVDIHGFERAAESLVARYHNRPLEEINMGQVLIETIELSFRFRVRFPGSLSLLGKSLLYVENIARQIDPELNLVEMIRSYSQTILYGQLKSELSGVTLARTVLDFSDLMLTAPRDLRTTLDLLASGQLRLELDHHRIERPFSWIGRSGNNIALSILAAGLLLGSSFVIGSAPPGPTVFGHPDIGVFPFTLGIILAVFVVYRVVRARDY
jgi:ubiquinone biosynthesis protein